MKKFLFMALLIVPVLLAFSNRADARSEYLTTFNGMYGAANTVLDDCATCHGTTKSIRNPYGQSVEAGIIAGKPISQALTDIEPVDSDSDGYTNITEIQARTKPGDATSTPAPAPTCTDSDGDHYYLEGSVCGTQADCNDGAAGINPGACDILRNGIDENCNGSDRTKGKACQ